MCSLTPAYWASFTLAEKSAVFRMRAYFNRVSDESTGRLAGVQKKSTETRLEARRSPFHGGNRGSEFPWRRQANQSFIETGLESQAGWVPNGAPSHLVTVDRRLEESAQDRQRHQRMSRYGSISAAHLKPMAIQPSPFPPSFRKDRKAGVGASVPPSVASTVAPRTTYRPRARSRRFHGYLLPGPWEECARRRK